MVIVIQTSHNTTTNFINLILRMSRLVAHRVISPVGACVRPGYRTG